MMKEYDCGFTKENKYYKAFPSFMKDYLCRENVGIEHIVTDERTR